jgi:hypothetical protein
LKAPKRVNSKPIAKLYRCENRSASLPASRRAASAWLQRADLNGFLQGYFNPSLTPEERGVAAVEGWILGVV